jgi:N-acetylneuraminate synthase
VSPEPILRPGRCLIIGEVALTHDGSLGLAHAFVDAIADAGADAVKFQTHIAAAESTPSEPFRIKFSKQDKTRYDYWKRMEFTAEGWRGLADHARERGLTFLSSPFSIQAVELLDGLGMPVWKIASGETSNAVLLDRISRHRQAGPALDGNESPRRNRRRCRPRARAPRGGRCISVHHGVSHAPPEKIGLNMIPLYRERYGCWVGLSDHSATIYPGLAGAALGMDMLEVHVALSREMFGPDVIASITTHELRQLVDGVRFIERMRAHPLDKDASAVETAPLRKLFTRSLVASANLPAGTVIVREHVAIKKPGTGLPPDRLESIIGRRLRVPSPRPGAGR